jgi:hypothetical protein
MTGRPRARTQVRSPITNAYIPSLTRGGAAGSVAEGPARPA